MEDETTVSDRKQLIHVSNPQRCPGDESDSDWWIHWSSKKWSIRSLHCDVTFSPPLCRNHRVKKPTQESDNTTFSGGEDNGDARSHLSHDSAPSHTPHPPGQTPSEAGPSRKRPRASDDGSGGEVDSGSPTPPLRRHKEGPGSEIELVFRPHPQLVHGQDYNQTRWDRSHESNCYTDSNRDVRSVPSCYFSSKCFFSAGSWRRQPTPPWTICPSTSLCASLWRKDRPMERLRTEEERREEEKLREEQEVEKDPVWTASVRNSTPSTSWREEDSSLWVWKPSRVNRYNVFEPGCCDQLHH